ncbi:MAG: hypothetical protein EPN14_10110 [Gallionella sp.]|nr:MAG: hypothetical protein EPN14_10110 [Gallionella sp.]
MFSSKKTAVHDGPMKRRTRASLLALALLGTAGMLAPPLAGTAFAAADNASIMLKRKKLPQTAPVDDAASIQKRKQEYERLAASVKALSGALDRESQKVGIDNAEVIGKAALRSKEAAQLAATGAYDKARLVLDESYHNLTAAIVTLENTKNQGAAASRPSPVVTADPNASIDQQREFVTREITTNKALVDALKRQNKDKKGDKESEIVSLEADASEAAAALEAGDIARAGTLIHDANSRVKEAIASLQKRPTEVAQQHEEGVGEDIRNSYIKRKESVAALMEAGKRIDHDRGTSHADFAKAEALIKEAETLAAAERFADGKAQLDRAYLLVKGTMRGMLNGREVTAGKPAAAKTPTRRVKAKTEAQH